ncbi:cadherin repeat domain-containing protein [Nocardioides daphniae]|uniref:Cadherin domain-containing protein n=1 Tax=Nocardioides daphniae TaxID=402297 RepID=A0A4P7U9P9_9ACTN|nr:cadherin repeat domain-containing protein [Nocardioides daphniae]QCC76853.1 hypothetical protein E2C04_05795 [Nocardioides daphniae]
MTDRGGLTRTTDVTIAVTDVNEAPTALALSRNIVVENAPADTVVGTIEVTDPDAGAPYRFQVLPGADGDDFAVRGDQLVSSRPWTTKSRRPAPSGSRSPTPRASPSPPRSGSASPTSTRRPPRW